MSDLGWPTIPDDILHSKPGTARVRQALTELTSNKASTTATVVKSKKRWGDDLYSITIHEDGGTGTMVIGTIKPLPRGTKVRVTVEVI